MTANSFAQNTSSASAVAEQGKSGTHWYGSEIIISGVAFDALTIGGLVAHANDMNFGPYMILGGVAGRVITPPLIHLAHGNGKGALGSLALQTLLPVAAGAAGFFGSCALAQAGLINLGNDHVGSGYIFVGLLSAGAGAIAATAIDAAVLAKEPVQAPRAMTGRAPSWNVTLVPVVDPKRAGFSLIGQF